MTAPAPPGHESPDPLSQVRHDLKTPINQIIGYSEMLAEDAEDKSVLADLAKITAAAKTLLELIDKELKLIVQLGWLLGAVVGLMTFGVSYAMR